MAPHDINYTMKLSIVVLLIATTAGMAAAQPYADCDMNTYYSSLSLAKDRAEMHTLIKNTHRNQLPYTSSAPDVWDALIALDSDGELFCLFGMWLWSVWCFLRGLMFLVVSVSGQYATPFTLLS